jgi:hypothetical protein
MMIEPYGNEAHTRILFIHKKSAVEYRTSKAAQLVTEREKINSFPVYFNCRKKDSSLTVPKWIVKTFFANSYRRNKNEVISDGTNEYNIEWS